MQTILMCILMAIGLAPSIITMIEDIRYQVQRRKDRKARKEWEKWVQHLRAFEAKYKQVKKDEEQERWERFCEEIEK